MSKNQDGLNPGLQMAEVEQITKTEFQQINEAYDRMLRSIKVDYSEEDRKMIQEAFDIAMEAHKDQRRKSGEPYIFHPIEVARICAAEIGLGPTAITCALLHDVVEDTHVTLKEILDKFGPKVATIVDGLTKLDGTYTYDNPQAENLRKVLSTLVEDVRVVLIKMADRLHNLRTIGSMPQKKQLKIAAETMFVYAPLAHRLGLYNVKTEFQDICMYVNDTEVYNELVDKLNDTNEDRNTYIDAFIAPLSSKLNGLGFDYEIIGRPKSIYSIYSKIKSKNVDFEEIYDLFAIRIIIDVPKEREKFACWQVYSIVTDVYNPIPERLKDWVTNPKSNGYESLHSTVIGLDGKFVEVQIRSRRMDDIAERGFAAHWKYKGIDSKPNIYEHWLDNIRSILESENTDAMEFMSDFKTSLFNEEVYVYTPKGDMKVLPKGATALDFAFSIHSDVGSRCSAVKVNKKLVPLGYKLNSGDKVEVITSKNQKPTEDWLKLVITGKARSKIRLSLKEEMHAQAELGKEALMRKLKSLKVNFEPNIDGLFEHFGYNSRQEFYFAIQQGQVDLSSLKQLPIVEHNFDLKSKEQSVVPVPQEQEAPKKKKKKGRSRVYINDEDGENYVYSFANCCKPVPGDKIFGYVTAGRGVRIHRANCPNSTHIMANYGYRMVKTEWAQSVDSAFVAELVVQGVDDGPGLIQRLTDTLSNKLKINIRTFNISGNQGYFEGKISLIVMNTNQLQVVINTLMEVPGISKVMRTN